MGPKEIHKGNAAMKVIDEMLSRIEYNRDDSTGNGIFIMAVGNDRSDEKMFEAVELCCKQIGTEYGFTVRIGMAPTQARFYLTDQKQMLWLLNTLSSIQQKQSSFFNVPQPTPIKSRRSHSYSSGLSSLLNTNDNDNDFKPLLQQKSLDVLPIPPTAPMKPIGITQYNKKNKIKQNITNFDLVSPEYSGSFFDNVRVRSASYTSLSRLAKLSELSEQLSTNSNGNNNDDKDKDKEQTHRKQTQ